MVPFDILAKALQPGDTIAFVSLSARLNEIFPEAVARATSLFESHGYKVRVLFTPRQEPDVQRGIADRLAELREALLDPAIAAVICTIGGETSTELLPALVAGEALHAHVRANPKSRCRVLGQHGATLVPACADRAAHILWADGDSRTWRRRRQRRPGVTAELLR